MGKGLAVERLKLLSTIYKGSRGGRRQGAEGGVRGRWDRTWCLKLLSTVCRGCRRQESRGWGESALGRGLAAERGLGLLE